MRQYEGMSILDRTYESRKTGETSKALKFGSVSAQVLEDGAGNILDIQGLLRNEKVLKPGTVEFLGATLTIARQVEEKLREITIDNYEKYGGGDRAIQDLTDLHATLRLLPELLNQNTAYETPYLQRLLDKSTESLKTQLISVGGVLEDILNDYAEMVKNDVPVEKPFAVSPRARIIAAVALLATLSNAFLGSQRVEARESVRELNVRPISTNDPRGPANPDQAMRAILDQVGQQLRDMQASLGTAVDEVGNELEAVTKSLAETGESADNSNKIGHGDLPEKDVEPPTDFNFPDEKVNRGTGKNEASKSGESAKPNPEADQVKLNKAPTRVHTFTVDAKYQEKIHAQLEAWKKSKSSANGVTEYRGTISFNRTDVNEGVTSIDQLGIPGIVFHLDQSPVDLITYYELLGIPQSIMNDKGLELVYKETIDQDGSATYSVLMVVAEGKNVFGAGPGSIFFVNEGAKIPEGQSVPITTAENGINGLQVNTFLVDQNFLSVLQASYGSDQSPLKEIKVGDKLIGYFDPKEKGIRRAVKEFMAGSPTDDGGTVIYELSAEVQVVTVGQPGVMATLAGPDQKQPFTRVRIPAPRDKVIVDVLDSDEVGGGGEAIVPIIQNGLIERSGEYFVIKNGKEIPTIRLRLKASNSNTEYVVPTGITTEKLPKPENGKDHIEWVSGFVRINDTYDNPDDSRFPMMRAVIDVPIEGGGFMSVEVHDAGVAYLISTVDGQHFGSIQVFDLEKELEVGKQVRFGISTDNLEQFLVHWEALHHETMLGSLMQKSLKTFGVQNAELMLQQFQSKKPSQPGDAIIKVIPERVQYNKTGK